MMFKKFLNIKRYVANKYIYLRALIKNFYYVLGTVLGFKAKVIIQGQISNNFRT